MYGPAPIVKKRNPGSGGPENVALTLLGKAASFHLTQSHWPVSDLCPVSLCPLGKGPCPIRSPSTLRPTSPPAEPTGWPGGGCLPHRGPQSPALLLLEAKPPCSSPHCQFYIHTLKTFSISQSILPSVPFTFYYVCNRTTTTKNSWEEIGSKLQHCVACWQLNPSCAKPLS